MVVVMNRDQPTAVMVGIEQLGGVVDIQRIKLAMAMQMFRQKTLSIGAAAKFAGRPLGEMLGIVSAAGWAVVDYPAQDIAGELTDSQRFERATA
jgi:predicted HTH domain antitoxin